MNQLLQKLPVSLLAASVWHRLVLCGLALGMLWLGVFWAQGIGE